MLVWGDGGYTSPPPLWGAARPPAPALPSSSGGDSSCKYDEATPAEVGASVATLALDVADGAVAGVRWSLEAVVSGRRSSGDMAVMRSELG